MHMQLNAAHLVAITVAIYGVLQAMKKAGLDAYISGRLGIVFAVASGFISTIALAGSLSVNTVCAAIAVALAASGLHANVKVAAAGTISAPTPKLLGGSGSKAAVLLLLLGITGMSVTAFSCGAWDQNAYETLAVTKAVVDTAAADYSTGAIARTKANYTAITDAQKAQTVAVEALETYELAKASASTATSALQADLNAATTALANVNSLASAIEAFDPKAAASAASTSKANPPPASQ